MPVSSSKFHHFREIAPSKAKDTLKELSNTLALNEAIDGATIHVQLSSDGTPFVLKDIIVDDSTDGAGFAKYHPIDDLKRLGVPSLDEVLDCYANTKSLHCDQTLHIELKSSGAVDVISKTLTKFSKESQIHIRNFVVSSFLHPELKALVGRNVNVQLGTSIMGVPHDFVECAKKNDSQILFIDNDFAEPSIIAEAVHNGLIVIVRGVKRIEHTHRLKDMGARGAIYAS